MSDARTNTDRGASAADRGIRRGTTAAVLLVAAVAAVVSYVHIEHESVRYGQDALASLLMPLSIDGAVAAASLVMLRAARLGVPVPWLGRTMLALSVLATLAANVGYGAAHGVPGALISGWPAVAFVGSVELAVSMVRRTRAAEVTHADATVTHTAPATHAAAEVPPRTPHGAPGATPAGDIATLSQSDAIRRAIAEVGEQPAAAQAWLAERGREVATSRIHDVIRRGRQAAPKLHAVTEVARAAEGGAQ